MTPLTTPLMSEDPSDEQPLMTPLMTPDCRYDQLCSILRRCKLEGESTALSPAEQSVLTKLQLSIRDHLAARRQAKDAALALSHAPLTVADAAATSEIAAMQT